jgi:hypothetical protein
LLFALGGAGLDPVPLANALEGFIDTVIAAISFSLGNTANVENLLLAAASAAASGTGNELDNVLTGNGLNNVLQGLAGNDTLSGGDGNDTLDGGAGLDVAAYSGSRSGYAVGAEGTAVSGPEGSDVLLSVERVQFGDRGVAFDLGLGESAGNTVRVIGAALDAQYNGIAAFVGIGIDLFEAGMNLLEVCAAAQHAALPVNRGFGEQRRFVSTKPKCRWRRPVGRGIGLFYEPPAGQRWNDDAGSAPGDRGDPRSERGQHQPRGTAAERRRFHLAGRHGDLHGHSGNRPPYRHCA